MTDSAPITYKNQDVSTLTIQQRERIHSYKHKQLSWTIEDFEIGKFLGRGKFGRVYLAREKRLKKVVALKLLIKKDLLKANITHQLKKEIDIHSQIRHPHIVRLYATFQDAKRVYIVLQYAKFGDSYRVLKHLCDRRLDEHQAAQYIAQLLSAVKFLHNCNIIHRDIKPENLLFLSKNHIMLADFGWSTLINKQNRRETLCGTLDYLSPEMLQGSAYDKSVDIWAIGIVMYEFLCGRPPFEAANDCETVDSIIDREIQIPLSLSPAARDLLHQILQKQPDKRVGIDTIIQHSWFIQHLSSHTREALFGCTHCST